MELKKKYDVFISYRRESSESAQLVATHLRAAGYRVFIDVEALHSGKFNEQLYEVIDNCKDFLVILPENALDRCVEEEDWVRKEVCRAMAGKKNIIPVMLRGFTWPDPMPQGMEPLKDYQAVSATSSEYFDMSMQRLCKYLKSHSKTWFKKLIIYLAAILTALAILVFIGIWLLRTLALPLYTKVADDMTQMTSHMALLASRNDTVGKIWDDFYSSFQSAEPQEKEALLLELNQKLDDTEALLKSLPPRFSPYRIELDSWQVMLLGLRDIKADDAIAAYPFLNSIYEEHLDNITTIRAVVEDAIVEPSESQTIKNNVEYNARMAKLYYYGYLHLMTGMPDKALSNYRKVSPTWRALPVEIGLNYSKEQIEQLTDREFSFLESIPPYKRLTRTSPESPPL